MGYYVLASIPYAVFGLLLQVFAFASLVDTLHSPTRELPGRLVGIACLEIGSGCCFLVMLAPWVMPRII